MIDRCEAVAGSATSPLLAAAQDVARLAGLCAAEAEQARRLDPQVMKALVAAGFARHFVPAEYGGDAGDFGTLTGALVTVGEACAASAWTASIVASLGRMAGFLPAAGGAEVWQHGPDAVIVGSLAPLGRAEAVPGGWRLSGGWPSISGVDYSDWALVRAHARGAEGSQLRIMAIPRRGYAVQDTWSNVGMCATGSNSLRVTDLFVPAARTFPSDDLFTGRAEHEPGGCHSVPLHAVNGLSFAAPALGAARGALGLWRGYAVGRSRGAAANGSGPAFYAGALARSAGEIDAAQLLVERAAAVADRGVAATPLETARNARDCALAMELMLAAANRIFGAAGTRGQSVDSPLQRFWRDLHAASTHVGLQFEPAAIAYAAQLDQVTERSDQPHPAERLPPRADTAARPGSGDLPRSW